MKSALLVAGLLALASVGCERRTAGAPASATVSTPLSLPTPSFTIGPTLVHTSWEKCARQVWAGMPTPPPPQPTPAPTIGPISDLDYIDWEARARQVWIGMRRADVERLLPSYSRPLEEGEDPGRFSGITIGTGGSQAVRYHVSENVEATIYYDYKGVPRDPNGTATSHTSPENQVQAPVRIVRSKKMVFSAAPLLGQ